MDKSNKTRRESKEEKLKDQKIEEQILSSLETSNSPDERFKLLLAKHVESERSNRRLKQDYKLLERQLENVLREKENLQRDYNKSVLMRHKVEEVCREQQKLIKSVKNESMQKLREEEERRKESQLKFQASLNEITQSLSKNGEENLKLREHNDEMRKKIKYLADQYQLREQQFEKLSEQVKLEGELNQAKMNKVQMETAIEKEILIKEKEIALEKLAHSQKLLKELTEQEAALKERLNLYTAKYDDFQSSLQKSNDVFVTYKTELEKMGKETRKLEKQCAEWKRKWERSNATVIELATEKQERDNYTLRCNKQVEQLQKLLRALQSERNHLYKVLSENNIECPALPVLPPEPEPLKTKPVNNAADRDRMDVMTKSCAEMKQTLATLQNQIRSLNMKESQTQEDSSKHTTAAKSPAKSSTNEETNKKRQKKKQKSKNKNAPNSKENSPAPNGDANVESASAQSENNTKDMSEEANKKEVPILPTDGSLPNVPIVNGGGDQINHNTTEVQQPPEASMAVELEARVEMETGSRPANQSEAAINEETAEGEQQSDANVPNAGDTALSEQVSVEQPIDVTGLAGEPDKCSAVADETVPPTVSTEPASLPATN